MQWYERVKDLKKQKKITTDELSKNSGIPTGTLNKLLTGQTKNPSYDTYERLAKALGTSVKYITDGNDDSNMRDFFEKYEKLDQKGKDAVNAELNNQIVRMEAEARRISSEIGLRRKIYIYDVPVSAGCGSFLESSTSSAVSLAVNEVTDRADYGVKVSGNSMEPRYFDGDTVIVESCSEIPVGKVGIFLYNGESYIKKYEGDRLHSINPAYKDIVFKPGDSVQCLGLVLGTISKEK